MCRARRLRCFSALKRPSKKGDARKVFLPVRKKFFAALAKRRRSRYNLGKKNRKIRGRSAFAGGHIPAGNAMSSQKKERYHDQRRNFCACGSYRAEGDCYVGGNLYAVRGSRRLRHGLRMHSAGLSEPRAAGIPQAEPVHGDRLSARVQYHGGQGV